MSSMVSCLLLGGDFHDAGLCADGGEPARAWWVRSCRPWWGRSATTYCARSVRRWPWRPGRGRQQLCAGLEAAGEPEDGNAAGGAYAQAVKQQAGALYRRSGLAAMASISASRPMRKPGAQGPGTNGSHELLAGDKSQALEIDKDEPNAYMLVHQCPFLDAGLGRHGHCGLGLVGG